MIYYIDPINGIEGADGRSPEAPRKTYTELEPSPGDKILFKRGSFIRDSLYRKPGAVGKPVAYGAYGEGNNPVFCGSVDVSEPSDWEEKRQNVWRYKKSLGDEACNFIYDNGRLGGTLRWEEHLLCAQGDWYHSCMGMREAHVQSADDELLIYSEGNPGEVYSHIECAVWGKRGLSQNTNYTVCEDLCFYGSGVHAMPGGADHITVRRCSFCFIGGAVWNRQLGIRFGNAIEFWNHCRDVLIEDCYFNNIYDSAITHQGGKECEPAENFVMRNNLFINYGMGAYEGRDRMSVASSFNNNICLFAGGGFSGFGDTKPRKSEIYPQPMGHHLFMWRIPEATEGGYLEVSDNLFYEATGAAMYSIISDEAEAQMKLHGNRYYTSNTSLFNKLRGKSYSPAEFDKYLFEYGEEGAEYIKSDISAIEKTVEEWFLKTGCGSCGEKLFTDKLPTQKYFTGSTTKDALSYSIGEDICFKLTLTEEGVRMGCPIFKYYRDGDDGITDEGCVSGASGEFEYHTSLSKAGYVHLKVVPCDENGHALAGYDVFEGGAGADFNNIRRIGKVPSDFEDFWERVIKNELDTVAPEITEKTEFNCGDPADIVYDLKIACPGKYPVSGYLRMPRNAGERSLPIKVNYMGYGVSSAPVPLKENAIQLCINQHGIVNGKPFEYYSHLSETEFAGFGFDNNENTNPDTVYFKYMILRALQAIRFCKTLPEWDGNSITVSGGSMGAFQAISAAAHDSDVTFLDVYIPWMCDLRGIDSGRLRGWRPDSAVGLDYFDTAVQAARVNCRTKITAGLGDYVCPPSGITALYDSIKENVTLEMLQNKTHPYTAPVFESYRRSK